MIFEIELDGRLRQVSVEPAGAVSSLFRVEIDGLSQQVDLRRLDDASMSLIFVGRGSTSRLVSVDERGAGRLVIHTETGAVPITVNGRRQPGRQGRQPYVAGARRVEAPMPGRVVRVLVSVSEHVIAGQPLVVVEAMKMANELTSPKDGCVAEIPVKEGMSVESGHLLVVVE